MQTLKMKPQNLQLIALISLLCLSFLSFVPSANEWHYLGGAKHWFNPQWIPNTLSYDLAPSFRITSWLFSGPILNITPIEYYVFFMNAFVILMISIPLFKLYKKLNISLLHLGMFIVIGQSLVGEEQMLLGVEARHFAYIFILWAIYFIEDNNIGQAALMVILATIFHIAVGGLFFGCFTLYLIYTKWKYLKEFLILYAAMAIPLIFITSTDTADVDIEFYTQVRNAHHTLAAINAQVVMGTVLIAIAGTYHLYKKQMFPAILAIVTFILTIISMIDTWGIIDQFFPLRIATVSLFVTLLYVTPKGNYWYFILIAFILSARPVYNNIKDMYKYKAITEIEQYIIKELPLNAYILDVRGGIQSHSKALRIEYKTERPYWVEWKFVNLNRFSEWKRRLEEYEGVDYIISDKPLNYKLLFKSQNNFIYEI